jgi:hypothetical protein
MLCIMGMTQDTVIQFMASIHVLLHDFCRTIPSMSTKSNLWDLIVPSWLERTL